MEATGSEKKKNCRNTQTSSFKLSLFIKAKLFIHGATRQIFQKVEFTGVIFYFPLSNSSRPQFVMKVYRGFLKKSIRSSPGQVLDDLLYLSFHP